MVYKYTRYGVICIDPEVQTDWYYSRIVKVASDESIVRSTKLVLYLGFGVRINGFLHGRRSDRMLLLIRM